MGHLRDVKWISPTAVAAVIMAVLFFGWWLVIAIQAPIFTSSQALASVGLYRNDTFSIHTFGILHYYNPYLWHHVTPQSLLTLLLLGGSKLTISPETFNSNLLTGSYLVMMLGVSIFLLVVLIGRGRTWRHYLIAVMTALTMASIVDVSYTSPFAPQLIICVLFISLIATVLFIIKYKTGNSWSMAAVFMIEIGLLLTDADAIYFLLLLFPMSLSLGFVSRRTVNRWIVLLGTLGLLAAAGVSMQSTDHVDTDATSALVKPSTEKLLDDVMIRTVKPTVIGQTQGVRQLSELVTTLTSPYPERYALICFLTLCVVAVYLFFSVINRQSWHVSTFRALGIVVGFALLITVTPWFVIASGFKGASVISVTLGIRIGSLLLLADVLLHRLWGVTYD